MNDGISSTVWSVCASVPLSRGISLSQSRSSADFTSDYVCHLLQQINRSFQASLPSSVRQKDYVCAFTFVSLRSSALGSLNRAALGSCCFCCSLLLVLAHTHIHKHIHTYILTYVLATLHALILYGLFASLISLPHTVL